MEDFNDEEEKSHFEEFNVNTIKRRDLLPWWIKVFCWIFMVFGVLGIVSFVLELLSMRNSLSFYGFETNTAFSITGLLILAVALFKGVTAYALWFEKDYAISFGKIDAIIGIALCGFSMFVVPFLQPGFSISIRLELALLIPYLIRLNKIKAEWEAAN